MLTTDLIRARVRKNAVHPTWISPDDADALTLATRLGTLFEAHVGKTQGEIDDALAAMIGTGTDFALQRGLARVLFKRAEMATDAPCDVVALRRRVFERAAKSHPLALDGARTEHTRSRDDVLAEVAAEFGMTAAQVDRALYADLHRAQVCRAFHPLAPRELVDRYNVALAQAVLLRATSLTITMPPAEPARHRQLFRYIRFCRLMHTVTGDRERGYTIVLDGPMSVFAQSNRYGLQMAEFLPALLLCHDWTLVATLRWGRQRRELAFRLDPTQGLRSHYPDTGAWIADEVQFFADRFERATLDWVLEQAPEIIDLDGHGVLIPDFVLRHRTDGREALLEIVGFWRRGYLDARLELLRERGPRNLVLAVSQRLHVEQRVDGTFAADIVVFKDIVPVRDVLERAERLAIVPSTRVGVGTSHDRSHEITERSRGRRQGLRNRRT